MVLSYSRKAYSEAVLRQDTETFLRYLENGFREFGGVLCVNYWNGSEWNWTDQSTSRRRGDCCSCQAWDFGPYCSFKRKRQVNVHHQLYFLFSTRAS
jgi:hypothetical protein